MFQPYGYKFQSFKDADKTKADTIAFEFTSLSPKTIIFKLMNLIKLHRTYLFICCFIFASFTMQTALNGLQPSEEARKLIDDWVETRQIISKERSDWKIERDLLNKTKKLLSSEVSRLDSELADLKASETALDAERSSLAEDKEALKSAAAVVSNSIGSLENQLKGILPSLPDPLIEKIKPLIRRLPEDPNSTDLSLGQRVQNIVGILSQTDKFNNTITLTSEAREFDSGKVVQVSTLYMGLASAYYVDDSGANAGIGSPTRNGWEWNSLKGSGSKIQQLVEIYEGTGEIQFIDTPAKMTNL